MACDYRTIILENLKNRNKKCRQFERVFQSYNALSERLNYVAAQNSKLRQRSRGLSDGGNIDSEAVERLQKELDNVYRLKAINDQQLIDTNNKLMITEKELKKISMERDEALAKMIDMEQRMEELIKENKELAECKTLVNDEMIALHATVASLEKRYLEADEERSQLIERLKNYKMQEIEMLNTMNEAEREKQLKRIVDQLGDAVQSSVDNNPTRGNYELDSALAESFEILNTDGPSEAVYADSHIDIVPAKCRNKLSCEASEIHDLLWHPNGKYLFTAGNDKKVTMYEIYNDYTSKKSIFVGASQTITRMDIDQDSKYLLGSSADHSVYLWTIDDQRKRTVFTGHTDKVASARFHMNCRQVISGSNDRTVKIWDMMNGRCIKTFFSGSIALDVASNDRAGAPIITSHCDKKVRFWDHRDNTPSRVYETQHKVTSLKVTHDGHGVIMMSRDETLSLLDVRNFTIQRIFSAEQFRTSTDTARCCISAYGSYVSAGSADGQIFVWDMTTTKLEKILYREGHEGSPVLSIAWHPHGKMIASGDRKKTICLWA